MSRAPAGAALRFTGNSSWGQFLDVRGQVKAGAAAAFVAGLDNLDREAPWRVFPLPALGAEAAVAVFAAHFAAGRL